MRFSQSDQSGGLYNAAVRESYHSHIFPADTLYADRNNSSSTIFRGLEKEHPVRSFIFPTASATRCNVRQRWEEAEGRGRSLVTRNHLRAAIFVRGRGSQAPGNGRSATRSPIRLIFYLGERRSQIRRMHSAHAAPPRATWRACNHGVRRSTAVLINTPIPRGDLRIAIRNGNRFARSSRSKRARKVPQRGESLATPVGVASIA